MKKWGSKKLPSLQVTLMAVFAASWLIPIAVFSFFIFYTYQNAYIEKSDNLIKNAVNVSGVLVMNEIDEAVTKMQKPTYEGEWESMFDKYAKGKVTRADYLTAIKASLISKFYMDDQIARYAFYMTGDESACCYSGKNGYSYEDYMTYVQPVVDEVMQKDSDYVEVYIIDNQIYLMRNLYTVKDYKKYGTLVVGINRSSLFQKIPLEESQNIRISVNGETEYLTKGKHADEADEKKENVYEQLVQVNRGLTMGQRVTGITDRNYAGYAFYAATDNYELSIYYLMDEKELYSGIAHLNVIVVITLAAMACLMLLTYFYLSRQIEHPLKRLMDASMEIKDGKFGSVIDGEKMPNMEFDSLVSSFNAMSLQVKHLFDTVYMEKMATKDAQIAALQAQINPHFLNNTLEMMNWQARMNNDIEVCKMIESLGTVLDSSMNRKNDRLVRLADELRCGDAFLYIMSMRFGQRLKVERNIDESLQQIYVPQLILQPLLENAIKHGIEKVSSGTIWLEIYRDGENVNIDVINTGKPLTEKELVRIQEIIAGTYRLDKSEPGVHTSIGIYNVNKRISLIFGAEYGLKVMQTEDGRIVSRIVIPLENELQD
ncbi:histidine kinase [bacterium]|nr:histidine kinase [bacterium]